MDIANRIDPETHPELREDADEATRVLEEVLGRSADLVKGEWYYVEDSGPSGLRSAVGLRLVDPFSGIGNALFTPSELKNPILVRRRLYDFWLDLLQQRSHESLDRLDKLMKVLEQD